ncbi:phosphoenolpyruvate--protein phosphotransferase [Trinickia violacea]|uniref:Phosphoenolpyruvate-protein phosphotransferase n=1 Tax=Trinickia violacea TaxID=2571746 RepID=A0A4P8IXX8_9BURK|nr:phosphoenolpyruvate--protein phosphotransferase [Trinickia violacea]QCP54172.1 phosphoenolpyruvate--protein phosphotransferase [Trinickia violacea]
MADLMLKGRPASAGFAAGPQTRLAASVDATRRRVARADSARELADLRAAIACAADQLRALVQCVDERSAEIIGFQIALIEDDELCEPIYAAIREGRLAADDAWRGALDDEIETYATSASEYFRARASDLMDLRDRVLACLLGDGPEETFPPDAVLVGKDLSPSRFLSIDWTRASAIVLTEGSATSHVAMLARAKGVPMIVGLDGEIPADANEVLVDAVSGSVIVGPDEEDRQRFRVRKEDDAAERIAIERRAHRPAVTLDGTTVSVNINVADLTELDTFDVGACDGVGLVRTELLFDYRAALPTEEIQYRAYCRLLHWAAGRPVVVRTLDAGGDKPIAGLTIDGESNPFLGVRGVRLSLARPEIFRIQLRALARAAVHGDLKVMVPMVTVRAELQAVRAMFDDEVRALRQAGVAAKLPPLGVMIEVPAAAIAPEVFDADFYSIGSNDLTQYVTAAGRDNGAVGELADPLNPGVLRLIAHVVHHGASAGIGVSLCGDAAADPAVLPHLLACGLRSVSVGVASVGRVKAAIADVDLGASDSDPPLPWPLNQHLTTTAP